MAGDCAVRRECKSRLNCNWCASPDQNKCLVSAKVWGLVVSHEMVRCEGKLMGK
jgi:hypothetical protein